MFKVQHYRDIEAEPFEGVPGVTVRWVVDEHLDDAPTFAMRVIEVEPGCATPYHTHWMEHGNYIMEGTGHVRYEGKIYPVKPGDVVFVPPETQHQYVNDGEETLRLICTIPLPWVREALGK